MTTAIDQRYRLFAFPSYLKNSVKEKLKLVLKKHICSGANQDGDSPILLQEKPKSQPSVKFDSKTFSTYYSLFKIIDLLNPRFGLGSGQVLNFKMKFGFCRILISKKKIRIRPNPKFYIR